jgi:hypothetical protein
MPHKFNSDADAGQAAVYQIRVGGRLSERWADWFDGLTITHEGSGDTFLTGTVVDQAALHGLLRKVRDLGMPLISVVRVEPAGGSESRQVSLAEDNL